MIQEIIAELGDNFYSLARALNKDDSKPGPKFDGFYATNGKGISANGKTEIEALQGLRELLNRFYGQN